MRQSIKERMHALRMTFPPNYIKAFIIPSTDPHLSEYVAPHWMSREWISGFTGSAGTVVVLMNEAGLWTGLGDVYKRQVSMARCSPYNKLSK